MKNKNIKNPTGEGMSALSWKKKGTSVTAYNQTKLIKQEQFERKVNCIDM